ncbi:MAG TPA: hypothetical protein EYH54_01765 [Nautiliaceae bacterium]|nr:hypothetical protein [Nautiliaceae bacterium]
MNVKERIEELIDLLEEAKIEDSNKEELINILNEALDSENKENIIDKLEEFIYELEKSNIDEKLKTEIRYEAEELMDYLEEANEINNNII